MSEKTESNDAVLIPRCIRALKDASQQPVGTKTIVVLLDGTGDSFDSDNSNIVHLMKCLKKSDPSQVTYYQSGIGTYDAGGLSNGINAAFDMAIGSGLGVHIRDAYRFLMSTYRGGDKICLFGFSRGAYTARCLGGMLHKVGLLGLGNDAQVDFAYKYYKDDSEEGWKFSQEFKESFCQNVTVEFIGVFDSVASVGFIPRKLPLSSTPYNKATYFRHAIALDEHRAKFKSCRFQQRLRSGWKVTAEVQDKATKAETTTDVLEVWFSGCHADVGGGAVKNHVRHKLAQIPLRWMIRQCFEANTGIIFKAPCLAEEGLDVHQLYPLYQKPEEEIPHVPEHILERYRTQSLPPIRHRSNLLKPTTDDIINQTYEFDGDTAESTDKALEWLPERIEDCLDAQQPINDQLKDSKIWWILEFWPVKVRFQQKDSDAWVKKIRLNMGKHRVAQDEEPKLHWTVKKRMESSDYDIKIRTGRNSTWKTVF